MRYRVTLVRTVYEYADVYLEADNEIDAETKAMIEIQDTSLEWQEDESDTEVCGIEEL